MRLQVVVSLMLIATFICGCGGDLKKQVREHEVRMDALAKQVAQLEQANRDLQAALDGQVAAVRPGTGTPTNDVAIDVSDDVIASLTEQINDLVLAGLESTVDQRIASQVGTADDIQAIFSEVVVEEIDAREEAERREREQRRLQEAADRDTRGVQRRLESLDLNDEKQQQVIAARQTMREQLDSELAALRQQGASEEDLMAAVALHRANYELQVAEILEEEDLQNYFGEDRWIQRDLERIDELNEALALDQGQVDALVDAYAKRRSTISDGFYLEQRGYLGRNDMRENFEETRQAVQTTLQEVLTTEQYSTYQESGLGNSGRRGGRGPR